MGDQDGGPHKFAFLGALPGTLPATKKAGLGPSSQIRETPLQSEVLGRPLLLGGEGPSHGYQCRTSVKQFPLWN